MTTGVREAAEEAAWGAMVKATWVAVEVAVQVEARALVMVAVAAVAAAAAEVGSEAER